MNDTNNTPDAVREAVTEFRNRVVRLLHEMYNECTHSDTEAFAYERAEKEVRALMLPTALDSRAGDAGEGDRYTAGYAQGQADAAQLHQWMQDKAWQDTVLMLVHYQALAERTWLVGHEEAYAKLVEWWRHARALSETKSVEDIAATPAPAVDAVTAGEVLPRLTRSMMKAACKAHYGDDNIDGIDLTVDSINYTFAQGFARMWKGIRAALSHGEGVNRAL